MIIRDMIEADLPQVAAMEEASFSDPWSEQGFRDTLDMNNVMFLVAEQENEILGYCGIYLALDEGEITNVAVSDRNRKRGVGSQLMEELLRVTRQRGITNYVLEVRRSNEAAIALYQKFGFHIEGTRRDFYRKPTEDAYIMCIHPDE